MPWILLEETPAPVMRWEARLTAAAPESDPLSLALVESATVQVEGEFGGATVRLSGSNSGTGYVPFDALRHSDLVAVLPVLYLEATLLDADPTTEVRVTVVGRR